MKISDAWASFHAKHFPPDSQELEELGYVMVGRTYHSNLIRTNARLRRQVRCLRWLFYWEVLLVIVLVADRIRGGLS